MKAVYPTPEPDALRHVESLLRAAADFEPETRAPEGLAARAMQARGDRCRRAFPPAAGRWLVPAAAGAATLLLLVVLPVGRRGSVPTVPPPEPLRVAQTGPQPGLARRAAPSGPQPLLARNTVQPVPAPPAIPDRKRPGSAHRERPPKRARRAPETSIPRPPRVRWREQTIRRYASGILAPALVARQEGSDYVLTPAIVTLPAYQETTIQPTGHAEDMNYLLVSTLEENP